MYTTKTFLKIHKNLDMQPFCDHRLTFLVKVVEQWEPQYRTRSVFKWAKPAMLSNGWDFKHHSKIKLFVQILNFKKMVAKY